MAHVQLVSLLGIARGFKESQQVNAIVCHSNCAALQAATLMYPIGATAGDRLGGGGVR